MKHYYINDRGDTVELKTVGGIQEFREREPLVTEKFNALLNLAAKAQRQARWATLLAVMGGLLAGIALLLRFW